MPVLCEWWGGGSVTLDMASVGRRGAEAMNDDGMKAAAGVAPVIGYTNPTTQKLSSRKPHATTLRQRALAVASEGETRGEKGGVARLESKTAITPRRKKSPARRRRRQTTRRGAGGRMLTGKTRGGELPSDPCPVDTSAGSSCSKGPALPPTPFCCPPREAHCIRCPYSTPPRPQRQQADAENAGIPRPAAGLRRPGTLLRACGGPAALR